MQIDKIVAYHKALGDPTRIRLILLLSRGELSGQELADKLNVSAPTITHHAAKLREAALIHERRDKNTVYFSLNHYFLKHNASALLESIRSEQEKGEEVGTLEQTETNDKLKQSVLRNFFTKDGKLKRIPAQYKKKLIALGHVAEGLKPGTLYTEKELNGYIAQFHEDFATIRREFIMHKYMIRENGTYELNPQELWTRWELVK